MMDGSMMQPRRTLVYGEPGSGAVTTAKALARKLNIPFFDLTDERVREEALEGMCKAKVAGSGFVAAVLVVCVGGDFIWWPDVLEPRFTECLTDWLPVGKFIVPIVPMAQQMPMQVLAAFLKGSSLQDQMKDFLPPSNLALVDDDQVFEEFDRMRSIAFNLWAEELSASDLRKIHDQAKISGRDDYFEMTKLVAMTHIVGGEAPSQDVFKSVFPEYIRCI